MIQFSILDNAFTLQNTSLLKRWIREVISDEGYRVGQIQFIFCNQDYLLEINKRFLGHTYYTDVITFPYSDGSSFLYGDIYIDVNTVLFNANQYAASFVDETHRVMIHGILHLLGYDDQTDDEATFIHHKEDQCLNLLKQMH